MNDLYYESTYEIQQLEGVFNLGRMVRKVLNSKEDDNN